MAVSNAELVRLPAVRGQGPFLPVVAEVFVVIAFFFVAISDGTDIFRYLIYLVPFVIAGSIAMSPYALMTDKRSLRCFTAIVLSLIPAAYRAGDSDAWLFMIFMSFGTVVSVLDFRLHLRTFKWILLTLVSAKIGILILTGGLTIDQLIFADLDRPLETHTLPFIFGVLVGLFAIERKYWWSTLAFVGVVVDGKRMAIAAAIAGLAALSVYALVVRVVSSRKQGIRNFFVFVPVWAAGLAAIELPAIFDLFEPYVGMSMAEFTSGRSVGQILAYSQIERSDLQDVLIGYGMGTADRLARNAWGIPGVLVHNDYLRLLLDLGLICGLIYLFAYCAFLSKRAIGVYIASFLGMVLMTDNVLVYTYFHSLLALVVVYFRGNPTEQGRKRIRA